MKKRRPTGIVAALATPFRQDESLDESQLRNHVDRMVRAGIHAIFCLGTNGEFYSLEHSEKRRVMELVVEQCGGRVPVYAGTGCVTTRETIALTQAAETLGVDGVSIISPYFAESSQQTLYDHFSAVAGETGLPVLLYNNPARCGVGISWRTAQRLAEIPNIVGVKDSSGNFDNTLRYIEGTREFSVLSGNDSLILWTLMAGGHGAVSGVANILPRTMASIYDLWLAGNLKAAKKVQDSIRPVRDCMKMGNPNSVVKLAANLMGYNLGPARAPFNLTEEHIARALNDALTPFRELEE